MLLVLVVGGGIGWEVNRVAQIRRAVAVLESEPAARSGAQEPQSRSPVAQLPGMSGGPPVRPVRRTLWGEVDFDDQLITEDVKSNDRPAWVLWLPEWFRKAVGADHFRFVRAVALYHRPRPEDWAALKTLGSVHGLQISDPNLIDDDLIGLAGCSELLQLGLTNTRITDRSLAQIGQLRKLRLLYLGETKTTGAGLAALANLTKLEEVILNSGSATDTGLFHLRGLTNLRDLDARGDGQVTDVGLSYLRGMTRLGQLYISTVGVTDRGLAVLVKLPRLQILEISSVMPGGTPALTLSARGVEQLGQFPQLHTLSLIDPMAADDHWLRAIGKLKRLGDLNIVGAAITDVGLRFLAGMPELHSLKIESPGVTEAGIAALEATLPQFNSQLTPVVSQAPPVPPEPAKDESAP